MAGVRVDKWLWSVRLCKTRTQASELCEAGKVTLNGAVVKAAKRVEVGDRVVATLRERTVIVDVVELLEKRVGASVASGAYVDHSPPPEPRSADFGSAFAKRGRGAGRPTKRDRRDIDKLRGS